MSSSRIPLLMLPLWLLALLEVALLSFGKNWFGPLFSPLVLLACGIGIGLNPLLTGTRWRLPGNASRWRWLNLLVFVAGVGVSAYWLASIISTFPIDPNLSDVIPAIEHIYMERLFAGAPLYAPFSDFGWTIYPNYLPLQWLPYVVSHAMDWDPRWWAFAILCVVLFIRQCQLLRSHYTFSQVLLRSAAPWLLLWPMIYWNHDSFGFGVETLIAGYYLLLAYSFFSRSDGLRAGGILVTLLSRFSVLLWLPFYVLAGWREKGTASFIRIALMVIAGIVLIYIIPFLSKDWGSFMRGYNYYTIAVPHEWTPRGAASHPHHLFQGAGMAVWFYTYAPGDLTDKIALAKQFHIGLSLLAVAVMTIWYFLQRKRHHFPLFLLLSFKIYLAFFYGFIQVPYNYLYLVPIMITAMVLSYWPLPAAKEPVFEDTV